MLVAAFGVTLATVVMQGSSLGPVIGWLKVWRDDGDEPPMDFMAAEGAMAAGHDELVCLYLTHRIDDDTLRSLKRNLDREELGTTSAKAYPCALGIASHRS